MSATSPASGGPGVALLFEDAGLSAHLRVALIEAGARIVHEGPATEATREDLSGNGADVVVVNLDARVEEHLDALYDIFDEERQRIVFNDAEASSGLSGWDQARWARHLAAKLMDAHDVDPPRPAEGRPIEAHPTELLLPEEDMPEAPPAEAEAGIADASPDAADEHGAGQGEDLTAELEALLAEDGDLLGRAEESTAASASTGMNLELDEGDISDADLDAINAIPDAGASSAPSTGPDAASASVTAKPDTTAAADVQDDDDGFEETLRMFDQALAESEQSDDAESGQEDSAEALFLQDGPAVSTHAEHEHDGEVEDEEDIQPPAPLQDKALEGKGSPYSLVDRDDDSPLDMSIVTRQTVQAPVAPDWDLVDFDAETESAGTVEIIPQNRSGGEAGDPAEFGIEKMSASDYLAPESEAGDAGITIEPSLGLELEPMEQAVAPKMIEASGGNEMSLDADMNQGIRRAVVLAAGSSDESHASLREFLAAVDRVPEAAIVAVIHQQLGDDLNALAAELNAATAVLSVRVANTVGKVRHGDLVLVPAGKQAALEASGRLQLLDSSEQPLANPSIDLTMTLMAQELGSNVLAIVLAGDAIDALAGAQAVIDGGGKVWAVDPADCTDNTMVTVICEEQLAERTGTPQALAARMLEELS